MTVKTLIDYSIIDGITKENLKEIFETTEESENLTIDKIVKFYPVEDKQEVFNLYEEFLSDTEFSADYDDYDN